MYPMRQVMLGKASVNNEIPFGWRERDNLTEADCDL